MAKRSPRYPRHDLSQAIDMIEKLFIGVHQASTDVDSAAKVLGYAGSRGGAAAGAIGTLRQYGLIDGKRGDVSVSDLALRILRPHDQAEKFDALTEAAHKPSTFAAVIKNFNGNIPRADDPVKAFLIREEGFSSTGATEALETIRQTFALLDDEPNGEEASLEGLSVEPTTTPGASQKNASTLPLAGISPSVRELEEPGELISLPLGKGCRAEVRFVGGVTAPAYARLIQHLELLREIAEEDDASTEVD